MMIKPGYEYTLSIPQHDELGIGLLRKLLRRADISIDIFNELECHIRFVFTPAGTRAHLRGDRGGPRRPLWAWCPALYRRHERGTIYFRSGLADGG